MNTLLRILTVIPTPFNMIVLIVLIGCIAAVAAEIAKQVRAYLVHRDELQLKRDLIESGMSAVEIERVLMTKSTNEPPFKSL
jgi:hypothetical protein